MWPFSHGWKELKALGGREFIAKVPDLDVFFSLADEALLSLIVCLWSCVHKRNMSRWHFSISLCHVALTLTRSFLSVSPQSANEATQSA